MKKIIITELKEGKVLIAAFKEGCDPFSSSIDTSGYTAGVDAAPGEDSVLAQAQAPKISPFEGGLNCALEVWRQAEEHWAVAPKNPSYVAPPAPPAPPKTAATAAPAKTKAAPKKKPEKPVVATKAEPAKPLTDAEKLLAKVAAAQAANAKPEAEKSQNELPLLSEKPVETESPTDIGGMGEPKPVNPEVDPEAQKQIDADKRSDGLSSLKPVNDRMPKNKDAKIYLATDTNYEHPFKDIQEALTALGIPANDRPKHNRYDRLSKKLQTQIVLK